MITVIGSPKRTAVSISMPFSPKAPSPATSSTRRSGCRSLAAIANDGPDAEAAERAGVEPLAGRGAARTILRGAADDVTAVADDDRVGRDGRAISAAQR